MTTETIKIKGKVETKTKAGKASIVCLLADLPDAIRDMTEGQQINVEVNGKAYTVVGRFVGCVEAYLTTTEDCRTFSGRELRRREEIQWNEGYAL